MIIKFSQKLLLALSFFCFQSSFSVAQNAPVFETSAKDEIAANRYLAGSNYLD